MGMRFRAVHSRHPGSGASAQCIQSKTGRFFGGNPAPEKASGQTLPPRRQVEPGAEGESGMLLLAPHPRNLECQRTALRLTLLRLCGEPFPSGSAAGSKALTRSLLPLSGGRPTD
jgi:hypothetical protein